MGTAHCVRFLFVVASFGMATIMMNIFIGVLGESYGRAYDTRDRLFVRERAHTVYDFSTRYLVFKGALSLLRRNTSKALLIHVRPAEDCTCRWGYLWYCKQSNQVPETFNID